MIPRAVPRPLHLVLAVCLAVVVCLTAAAASPSYAESGLGMLTLAAGSGAAAAVVVGVRRHAPARPWGWWLLACSLAVNSTGALVELVYPLATNHTLPFLNASDPFYLASYPLAAAGLLKLIPDVRRTSPLRVTIRWAGPTLDAVVLTIAAAAVTWVFAVVPLAGARTHGSWVTFAVAASYPLSDVVLSYLCLSLVFTSANSSRASTFLGTSVALTLVPDTVWGAVNTSGWEPPGIVSAVLSVSYICSHLLLGHCALQPSMARIGALPARDQLLSPRRLIMLAGSAVTPPLLLGYEIVTHSYQNGVILVCCTVLSGALVLLRMALLNAQLSERAEEFRSEALTDPLTSLPNRRAGELFLERAIADARRHQRPLTIGILDLDHFKQYNDSHGHQGGDALLVATGATWQRLMRSTDLLARIGGEEFLAVWVGADRSTTLDLAGRLLGCVPDGQTVSIGIAEWNDAESGEDTIARADAALYEAKGSGRARLVQARA